MCPYTYSDYCDMIALTHCDMIVLTHCDMIALTHHDINWFDLTQHYEAVKRYISSGPLLLEVNMNSPQRTSRRFMDSLLAFWPGLQVPKTNRQTDDSLFPLSLLL